LVRFFWASKINERPAAACDFKSRNYPLGFVPQPNLHISLDSRLRANDSYLLSCIEVSPFLERSKNVLGI
ncbi:MULTISPECIES: hypothetical protein, partial [unclassified Methylophaga]|uniref:hypothetical protein n=1 Tax=unclassified Methylophaga TaxID=2629249 RepID=UPI00260037F7